MGMFKKIILFTVLIFQISCASWRKGHGTEVKFNSSNAKNNGVKIDQKTKKVSTRSKAHLQELKNKKKASREVTRPGANTPP